MKIPEQAKRVFQGVIFDVYQWPQKMFDGGESTFEMLKRPNTVTVIATQGESVYFAEEEQPTKPIISTLFGGRVGEGEDPLVAAKREVLEEAGLQSDDWTLYKVYEPVIKIDWQISVYIARNCRRVADQQLDAGERITIKEVSFDAFIDLVCSDRFNEKDFACDIMRLRLSPDADVELAEFKRQLFG